MFSSYFETKEREGGGGIDSHVCFQFSTSCSFSSRRPFLSSSSLYRRFSVSSSEVSAFTCVGGRRHKCHQSAHVVGACSGVCANFVATGSPPRGWSPTALACVRGKKFVSANAGQNAARKTSPVLLAYHVLHTKITSHGVRLKPRSSVDQTESNLPTRMLLVCHRGRQQYAQTRLVPGYF